MQLYQAQRRARTPFVCPDCFEEDSEGKENRKFTKSSLATHARSKRHRKAKALPIDCNVCGKKFDDQESAFQHFHDTHKLFKCADCGDAFPEFEKLKSHLRTAHKAEWPWICGFCDQPLLYQLEFEVHVRQHTDSPPFDCPLCKNSGHFEDIADLTEHLAERHLPKMSKTATIEKVTVTRMAKEDKSVPNSAAVAAAAAAAATAATAATPGGVRDENAVNREIAALLLNLHSSRGDQPATATPAAAVSGLPKAEDLSVKSVDNAMDLSKKQATVTLNTPLPASITKITKQTAVNGGGSLDLSTKAATSSSAATTLSLPLTPNYSQLYPSLASLSGLSSNSNLAMSSNYLLQNLLLGKMQQIAAASGGDPAAVAAAAAAAGVSLASTSTTASSSSSNGSLSFPTQPLPAQALSLPSTTSTLKPPAAVMKSTSSSAAIAVQNGQSSSKSPSSTTSATTLQQLQLNESNTSANIPLLCGQIVAQLNGLLFLVHGLNQPQIELNLQSQLVAIYTRLQEVVAMVEAAKKQEEENKGIQKTLEKMKENKMKEEESIAKQLQDYQRALLQQHQEAASSQPLKETAASVDVVTLLKRQAQAGSGLDIKDVNGTEQSMEVDSAAAARRRRGRPPKNSNLDLSYSPPDKRARESTDDPAALIIPAAAAAALNGVASPTMSMELPAKSQAVVSSGGGGGKGIRNRVFCGECAGCLKNDDCGRCRYCQDKTKFGGQNRLRQKCLHRRCLMDTHRKRSTGNGSGALGGTNNAAAAAAAVAAAVAASNAAVAAAAGNAAAFPSAAAGRSPSPSGIYSGLDLARLAEAVSQAEKIQNGDTTADSEAKSRPERRDSAATIEPMRRSTRSRQKSAESKQAAAAMAAAAAAANGNSDDDSDDQKSSGGSSTGGGGGKTQSRIDKWKAKHEAMMKLAEGKEVKVGDEGDDEPEAAVVGEHIGEVKDDDEDEEEEVAVASAAEKGDKVESDEPELPNIDGTNGVCIDLNGSNTKTAGSKAAGKPHTRHSAVQQQVRKSFLFDIHTFIL